MTFDEILTQVLELLRREGRVSYRALKRRFDLDEDYLEDLKAEIIQAKKLAVDEDGAVLVWTGDSATAQRPGAPPTVVHTRLSRRENFNVSRRLGGRAQTGDGALRRPQGLHRVD
jgi:hypothetical protein